jgi:glutathione S-transferase
VLRGWLASSSSRVGNEWQGRPWQCAWCETRARRSIPPMSMILYNNPVSGNCYKVRLLAAQLGLGMELRDLDVIDRSNRKEVLGGLNPALRVPTIILDDGRPLAESNAILWYLGDGTDYVPQDRYERAQVLQWLMFEQYSHEPYIAVARFWAIAGIEPSEEQRAEKANWGKRALAALDGHLRDRRFLVADRYTIADISLYAYTHVADEGGFELDRYPAIRPWLDRVAEQPGYIKIID